MDKEKDELTELEIKIAVEGNGFEAGSARVGELSHFACPECSGVLSSIQDGGPTRFRCHTGHAYSSDSLLSSLAENIEESLWGAIRGVEESVMLLNHIGDHFAEINQGKMAAKFFQKAGEASARNEQLREIVFSNESLSTDSVVHSPDSSSNGDVVVLPAERMSQSQDE